MRAQRSALSHLITLCPEGSIVYTLLPRCMRFSSCVGLLTGNRETENTSLPCQARRRFLSPVAHPISRSSANDDGTSDGNGTSDDFGNSDGASDVRVTK